jgi:hypothetical protein
VVDYPLPPTSEATSEVRIIARSGGISIYGVRVLAVGNDQGQPA